MAYIIWMLIGVIVAAFFGAGPHHLAYRPNVNASPLAGAFGALIGGIICDGLPQASAGIITVSSVVGAVIGAAIFCWAVRGRASDTES